MGIGLYVSDNELRFILVDNVPDSGVSRILGYLIRDEKMG